MPRFRWATQVFKTETSDSSILRVIANTEDLSAFTAVSSPERDDRGPSVSCMLVSGYAQQWEAPSQSEK